MATITASGIGSGLDIEKIVTQLLAIERQPLDNLKTEASLINAQISAYGSLKSKISDFKSAMDALATSSGFRLYSATSTDETVFTGTADSSAAAGNYAVEVTALAERDKYRTAAYTDTTSVVGEGTLNISVGADSFSINVSAANSNNTLATLRDAINNDENNTGVTATIVTDATGSSLVLSSDETGLSNALTVTVTGDTDTNDTDNAGLSALATTNLTNLSNAADASIQIDGVSGFTINSSTNTFSSAIEGVTITAKTLGTSTLSIGRDDEAILEAVNKFADAYNALKEEITTQRAGQLEADSTLLSIERELLSIFNAGTAITGSSFTYLSQVGITTNDEGKFTVDSSEITDALNTDFDSFVNLFSATGEGFASRLSSLASNILQTDGLIDAREDGLKSQLDRNEDDQTRLEARLELVEVRLRSQFSALDTLVSELNSSGNFLLSQLASLSQNNKS